MKPLERVVLLIAVSLLVPVAFANEIRVRRSVKIPDIPGYRTLKCDFHIHTVFSDGAVWPSVRSEEAWREGLDAIAITDHIEYQPHAADLPTSHDRSFEIAGRSPWGLAGATPCSPFSAGLARARGIPADAQH